MRISIKTIARICEASPADVRSALRIQGKPVFGDVVYLASSEVDIDLIRQIEDVRAMNASAQQRRVS